MYNFIPLENIHTTRKNKVGTMLKVNLKDYTLGIRRILGNLFTGNQVRSRSSNKKNEEACKGQDLRVALPDRK